MKCPYCDSEFDEKLSACPVCGAKNEQAAAGEAAKDAAEKIAEETTAAEAAPAAAEAAIVEPAAAEAAEEVKSGTPGFSDPPLYPETLVQSEERAPKKKKKKAGLIIGIVAAVLIIAAALLVALNFRRISNAFMRTFAGEDRYYQYVEKRESKFLAKSVRSIYRNGYVDSILRNGGHAEGELEVQLSSSARSILSDLIGEDCDFLKSANLSVESDFDGNRTYMKLGTLLNGQEIVRGEMLLDAERSIIYGKMPQISSSYFYSDFSSEPQPVSGGMSAGVGYKYQEYVEAYEQLKDALPDDETVQKLLEKYLKIAYESIENAEKGKDTLAAGDIEVEYNTIIVRLNERNYKKILKNVLTELKKDEDIKAIIKKFEKKLGDKLDKDLYESFTQAVDNALEHLDDYVRDLPDVTMTVYVDGKGEVKGRKITGRYTEVRVYNDYWSDETTNTEIEHSFTLIAAVPEKGGKFGVQLYLKLDGEEYFSFAGGGKKALAGISGEFDLRVRGQKMLTITAEKLNTSKYEEGKISGTLTFSASKGMLNMINEELFRNSGKLPDQLSRYVSDNALSSISIVIDFDTLTEKKTAGAALRLNGSEMISVRVTSTVSDKKGEIPEVKDAIPADQWADEANRGNGMSTIIDNLKKAGVPDRILSRIDGRQYENDAESDYGELWD